MMPAREALESLRAGNARFVAEVRSDEAQSSRARRIGLTWGQEFFAAILGCSDSRVPVEMVFNLGLGDLFVIRVAGNIDAPSQVGGGLLRRAGSGVTASSEPHRIRMARLRRAAAAG